MCRTLVNINDVKGEINDGLSLSCGLWLQVNIKILKAFKLQNPTELIVIL